jgi:ABC-type uncharacterized transport system ATPase subunit
MSAPAIETLGPTKIYGDARALDDLDPQVQGEFFGYLGPNGGKKRRRCFVPATVGHGRSLNVLPR